MTAKNNNTITINTNDIKHHYSTSKGVVIGKLWGGGIGSYTARNYKADTLKELKEKVQKAFELGSLDNGCGFERLLAAGVVIEDEATININDQLFTSSTYENYIIGDTDLFQEFVDKGIILE